ncbi:SDR family NAD(P)-dependent oxidoreductase [Dactylosporangium sp. CS-047395]|uniref:SDR family NAD(P)-dependent oxidoreductase n=1 Tax=Dactylosporangium sp. CS-047395 TaxID=3239936 RepID=UPI003D8F95BD
MSAQRVAVVTGAGNGIGAEVATALAADGFAVVVADLGADLAGTTRDEAAATRTVERIRAAGGTATAAFADVGDFEQAKGIIDTAVGAFGRLDVLINAAGIVRDKMIFNLGEDEWDAVIRVHLKGAYNTAHHASRWWRANRGGDYRLINIVSGAGMFGAPGQPNYAAAKMGVLGLTLSCANALKRYGVTSVAVWPSATTRMTSTVPADRAGQLGLRVDDEMDPANVAPGLVYLARPDRAWLNGQTVGFRGYRLVLYSGFEVSREIVGTAPWTADSAATVIEQTFRPAIERRGLFDAQAS